MQVVPLMSHRFGIASAEQAYGVEGGAETSLGILLAYPAAVAADALVARQARTVALLADGLVALT